VKQQLHQENTENLWLALEIGNSRLHWALFAGEKLSKTWDSDHLSVENLAQKATDCDLQSIISGASPPILLSSVVPSQTKIWQTYSHVRIITLEEVPIKGMYPTLGIDRALSLYGAGSTLGFPMLVIDTGTTLTFTGADSDNNLVGGAILPGLGLQLGSLNRKTGQLPSVETRNLASLPQRFALNTEEAMQSGVIYTLLAGIKDFVEVWWCDFPQSNVAIKGGDRTLVVNYMKSQFPEIAARLIVEPNLTFWGMRSLFFLRNIPK
jgi:type III pantothenate kinase